MDEIIGIRIKNIRKMTEEEAETEGWDSLENEVAPVIELENGVKIYPSRDEEGNGIGMLFGEGKNGRKFYIIPPR